MCIEWKDNKSVIGKSGDLLLAGRSERRFAQQGLFRKKSTQKSIDKVKSFYSDLLKQKKRNDPDDPFDEYDKRTTTWEEAEDWINNALRQNPDIKLKIN